MIIHGRSLHPGTATGMPIRLTAPLSFWGGTDNEGRIVDAHHPQCGAVLTGRILLMESGRGSSSASSVLAEQIRARTAPAAIILSRIAAELYGLNLPVIVASYDAIPTDALVQVTDGTITW
jgi:predicted aconitase with swiveling domain